MAPVSMRKSSSTAFARARRGLESLTFANVTPIAVSVMRQASMVQVSAMHRSHVVTPLARAIGLAALAACGALQTSPPSATPLKPAAVVASVPVGRGPTLLAISPDGSTVYAASVGQLAAILTTTNTVAATTRIDPYTTGIAVTP